MLVLAPVICPSLAWAPTAALARTRMSHGYAEKKATQRTAPTAPQSADEPAPSRSGAFATLAWVHDGSCVAIDETRPPPARFERLVADRIFGEAHAMDPRLLELLRTVAAHYPRARLELVSGFRSPKFNEMLRKKGHKVANQSQHSEGNAVDFRIIPEGQREPLDPFDVERWLRAELKWDGGIGVYPSKTDRFVHADVGKNRRWISR